MIAAIRQLFAELMQPSTGSASVAYVRGLIALGHVTLGAAAMVILTALNVPFAAFIVMFLYSLKELADRKKGGGFWDSCEDSYSVFLGVFTHSMQIFPIIALGAAGLVMIIAMIKSR